jgi:hypothetical protein
MIDKDAQEHLCRYICIFISTPVAKFQVILFDDKLFQNRRWGLKAKADRKG